MSTNRKKGFTLIEMLAVIAIIGVLLAVGIPSILGLMKSGGMASGTRSVASTLFQARQYAITHRTNTRVVFPYNGTAIASGLTNSMLYSSYAVLYYTNASPAWRLIGKFEQLPIGVTFMNAGIGALDSLLTTNALPGPAGSGSLTMPYLEFRATGVAVNAGTLSLYQGFYDIPTSLPTKTSTNHNDIFVDNIVGRVKVLP